MDGWRRAAALRGLASGRRRRRPRARDPAPRRPHLRRRAVLGQAEAAGAPSTGPVRSSACRRSRCDGHPAGAGRARRRAGRPRPGRSSPTARRSSPPSGAARALLVLFHVTADTTWSNLPLSGLFVDMLRRIVALSGETAAAAASGDRQPRPRTLPALVADPHPRRLRRARRAPRHGQADPGHFRGHRHRPTTRPASTARPMPLVAVNALEPGTTARCRRTGTGWRLGVQPLKAAAADRPAGRPDRAWRFSGSCSTRSPRCALGGGLGLPGGGVGRGLGAGAARAIAGRRSRPRPAVRADAGRRRKRDMDSALTTRLAYVGDRRCRGRRNQPPRAEIAVAGAGQPHLARSRASPSRSIRAATNSPSIRCSIGRSWPRAAARRPPPWRRVAAFMKNGGTIVFDTRDALTSRPGGATDPRRRSGCSTCSPASTCPNSSPCRATT